MPASHHDLERSTGSTNLPVSRPCYVGAAVRPNVISRVCMSSWWWHVSTGAGVLLRMAFFIILT